MKTSSILGKGLLAAASLVALVIGCSSGSTQATPTCATGETMCNKECIDTATDSGNCGACGTACKTGEVCSAGACSLTCATGTTQCGASCVDSKVDPKNCGACGTACNPGEICSGGKCAAQCPSSSQTLCFGDAGAVSCVNTSTDTTNCGACFNACEPGKVCTSGKCGDTCGPNELLCKGDGGAPYCAAIQSDNGNCGACGNACGNGQVCSNGKCQGNCGLNETLCSGQDGGAPYCAKTDTDQANCGACGAPCNTGAGEICSAGKCVVQCSPGLTQCGKECVDLNSSRDNCGACNSPCPANKACSGKVCTNLYFPSGVLTNVPIASLAGWSQCYIDDYSVALTPSLITNKCTGSKLLLGCYPNGSANLTVMAAGLTSDVEFATGNTTCGQNKVHLANGVNWYWDANFSIGFAPAADTVSLCQADTSGVDAANRLSWHTVSNAGGYRCGTTTGLNSNNAWTRVVYQAN